MTFGIAPSFLHDHDIKLLVHINPKLDDGFAPIKLEVSSCEDNSVFVMTHRISAGELNHWLAHRNPEALARSIGLDPELEITARFFNRPSGDAANPMFITRAIPSTPRRI